MQRTVAVFIDDNNSFKGAARIEVTDTEEERRQGFADVEPIPYGMGLLFKGPGTFWMKGVTEDLDIIFVKDDVIVDLPLRMNAPVDDKLELYSSPDDIDYCIEFAAGWLKEKGITKGDIVIMGDNIT